MKSEKKEVELCNKTFPCMMEYRIQGESLVGIFLVNKSDDGLHFSVCLINNENGGNLMEFGKTYFKDKLNLKEWFYLPKGLKITLTN